MTARILLIASVLVLATTPAAALAAESPTGLGYSSADIPALAADPTTTGAPSSAADVHALAAQPAAAACTGTGPTTAAASSTTSAYGAGVDSGVLGTNCANAVIRCPAGTTLEPAGTGTAGSPAVSRSGELIWLMPDPATIVAESTAGGTSSATRPATSSLILQESNAVWRGSPRSAGLPIGCLCPTTSGVSASGSLPAVRLAPASTLVAAGTGALFSAIACGLAVLFVGRRRRRRPTPVAPW
jgi:hypothetical protein